MRKLFYGISLIGILLSFPTLLIGQILDQELYSYDCIEEENNIFVDTTYRGLYESRNGASHSPHGEIRFLVAFVELIYDNPDDDPSLYGSDEWRPGELPSWRDSLLSAFTPNGISNCHLTKYYQNASSNNHIVLGDYLVAPTNGGVFQVNTISGEVGTSSIVNAINQQMGDTIITAHGLNSISYFDNWTLTNTVGREKVNVGDGHWDYVVFVIRNSIEPANSCGNTSFDSKCLLGYNTDAYTKVCTNKEIPTQVIRHEYAHMLLGGNHFHTGGGGWGYGYGDYWIPQTSGWGLLGLYGCSLWCWNAWDRQRLGWIDPNSTYEISARNINGFEVNGDLDATDPNDAGIYVLRDFVTTGDAIRIKLPYINSDKEYQEWLWIENHQGIKNNDNEFDQWQYQDQECVEDLEPGLMMYIQINNDTRVSENSDYIFDYKYNYANYTRVLTANGLWDREFVNDSVYANCVNYEDKIRPFVRLHDNPFTGTEDQSFYANDNNNDNSLSKNDQLKIWVEYDGSNYHSHLYSLGHSSHSFNLQGNSKIGIGTNPSTATLINMVGENNPYSNAKNLRKTYLNGISVEMLEQLPNGDIKIRVRFDDVDVENNVRWCSDSIVLNPIVTNSGYSLNLKSGRIIHLDQGLTPTRMTNPVMFNNQKIFASPTTFTVMPDAKLHLESLSKIIMENGSKMHLSEGSSCVIESAGYIEVQKGTTLQLDDCSSLVIKGRGKLIVREGAELQISPNAVLACENGFNNIVVESGVVIPNGFVNPITLINNTIGDVVINTNTNWNNIDYDVYGMIVVENDAVLNVGSSTLRFMENKGFIVKPGGSLIIDNSLLTSLCNNQWQGIEVWGVDSLHQQSVNGQYLQGHLELKNGATIENAVCAVELWNPLDDHSEGGMIKATDAIFRNNTKAVHALNYTNYIPTTGNEAEYVSSFRNCSFIIDSNYMGEEMFNEHVELQNVKGIDFHGCSFSVDSTVSQVSSTSHGIKAIDAGFEVSFYCSNFTITPCPEEDFTRSSFSGFETAIYVVNSGQQARIFTVRSTDFTNNVKGIYAQNTGYATITDSDFYVGADDDCSFGLYLNGVSNFEVERNTFSGNLAFSDTKYGIVVKNSASYNDIYQNSFSNLYCGNVSLGKNYQTYNRGLTYTCNTNTGNMNDYLILKDNVSDYGISGYQGSTLMSTGNTFSGSNYHIYNEGNRNIRFYCYRDDAQQVPDVFKVYNINVIGTGNINRCESDSGSGNDVMKSGENITSLEEEYNAALTAYNALQLEKQGLGTSSDIESQLSQHQTACLDATAEIVKFHLQQEETDYEELRQWLVKSKDIFADRMIVASFIQEGNYDDAMDYAEMISKIYNLEGDDLKDHNDYLRLVDLYIDLHRTNRSTNQLTDAELTMVKNIADNGIGTSQKMANSIMIGIGVTIFSPPCLETSLVVPETPSIRGEKDSGFAPVGAKWYYDYNYFWTSGYVLIESVSDTIIDGFACRKLAKSRNYYNSTTKEVKQFVLGYEYMTQIDDSVMIYRYGKLRKLYDLNAKIGDTLIFPGSEREPVQDSSLMYGYTVVVGKGTVELGGQTLRYIDLNIRYEGEDSPWQFSCYADYNNDYCKSVRICEKIGNISGYLLPEICYETDADEGGALRCYSDDIMSVSFSDKECDYMPSGVGIDETAVSDVNIFPNPANDNITISLAGSYNSIEIYDSFGRKVMSRQVEETTSQQVIDVDISNYPSGLYLVVVKDDNNRYYKRIVKN